MTDALGAIEAAIADVTKARAALRKKKSERVSASEEIDQLKSVSFAWFQTHRPIVTAHASGPNLDDVDAHYRRIMDSTSRRTTRVSFSDSLQNARRALVEVRGFVATHLHAVPSPTSIQTADIPPNF